MHNPIHTFYTQSRTAIQTVTQHLIDFDPRFVIAFRDLASFRYEKTIVLALVIQLVIAGFSSFLVVGLVGIYDSGAGPGQTQIAVTGPAAHTVLDNTQSSTTGYRLTHAVNKSDGLLGLQNGYYSGVLVAHNRGGGRLDTTLYVQKGSLQTTVATNKVGSILNNVQRVKRHQYQSSLNQTVLSTPRPATKRPNYGFSYTTLLPLLILLPVFISGSVIVDGITEELERGTLELLRVTPLTSEDILSAKLWVATVLGPIQAAFWFVLLTVNGIHISHPGLLLVLTGALTLLLVSVGSLIAIAIPERRYAQVVYSIAVILLSGVFTVFPEYVLNTIAHLAIGHPQPDTYITVGLYVVCGLVLYGVVRWGVVTRFTPNRL